MPKVFAIRLPSIADELREDLAALLASATFALLLEQRTRPIGRNDLECAYEVPDGGPDEPEDRSWAFDAADSVLVAPDPRNLGGFQICPSSPGRKPIGLPHNRGVAQGAARRITARAVGPLRGCGRALGGRSGGEVDIEARRAMAQARRGYPLSTTHCTLSLLTTVTDFTYIVDHDLGFAPNPSYGCCTLAACKPDNRAAARPSDVILGTGSKEKGMGSTLSYWMRSERVPSFDDYWQAARFQRKWPATERSMVSRYGDNIYRTDPSTGSYIQCNSFDSMPDGNPGNDNIARDTDRCGSVLVGYNYCYWGGQGPNVPQALSMFVRKTQKHKCRFSEADAARLNAWLATMPERGAVGDPANWPPIA